MQEWLSMTGTIYPSSIETAVLVIGLVAAIYTTYKFNKTVYYSSKHVFGILTRHFNALFRVSALVGIAEILYFAVRLVYVFSPAYSDMLIIFDLIGITLMVATVLLAFPLLHTLETIPRIYEVSGLE